MYQLIIKSPEGDEIELLASESESYCQGAQAGAQALFNLLADDMDLEDGYEISVKHSFQPHTSNEPPHEGYLS